MALSAAWFKKFKGDHEQREKLEQTIKGSGYVLDILSEYLEDRIKELQAVRRDEYDSPNWALKTAHNNGEIRALTDVLKITKIERNNPR